MDRIERARYRIATVCREAQTPNALLKALQEALSPYVPADRWCGLTLDPSTVLPTGGVHHEGVSLERMPRLLELEFGGEDANGFGELSRRSRAVATLSEATGGDYAASERYRDVLAPDGLRHELRAVFRDEAGPWAALVLLRGRDVRDFSAEEVGLVARVSQDVCAALRQVHLLAAIDNASSSQGPGLLLLEGGSRVSVQYASTAGEHWIAAIDDGAAERLPYALYSLALRAQSERYARCRIRTRAGQWLTAHAESMPHGITSLILEPSRPHEVAQVLAAAYGLTARESQVVRLVASGRTNAEVGRLLGISRYTVEDHLKHVYEKLSVKSRAELVSKLFFDHYLPREGSGRADRP